MCLWLTGQPDLQFIEFNINLPRRDAEECTSPTIATLLHERGYTTGAFGKVSPSNSCLTLKCCESS